MLPRPDDNSEFWLRWIGNIEGDEADEDLVEHLHARALLCMAHGRERVGAVRAGFALECRSGICSFTR